MSRENVEVARRGYAHFIDTGDRVVAVLRQRGASKATGVAVDMHLAHVHTFRDGKQIRTEMYASPQKGLAAAGRAG